MKFYKFSCEVRRDIEAIPDMFRLTGIERVYFEAVQSAAAFVGSDPSNLVMCNNLTSALNAVLNSLRLKTGEQGGNSTGPEMILCNRFGDIRYCCS